MKKAAAGAVNRFMSDNYFTVFALPQTYEVDTSVLHRAYIQLQQRYHPDRFARATDAQKLEAMQRSADANTAYMTLKDPLLRAEYMLGLQGIVLGDKPDAVKAAPALLMESMEMREALMEAEGAEAIAALAEQAASAMTQQYEQLGTLFASQNLHACAQGVMRLRFLIKFKQEVAARNT